MSKITLHLFLLLNSILIIAHAWPQSRYKTIEERVYFDIEKKIPNSGYTIILSNKTCNRNIISSKKTVHICYNGGKCREKLVPLNQTHMNEQVICECNKVKNLYFYLFYILNKVV